MKAAELSGALLDYWVAMAEGIRKEDIFWRKGGDFWTWDFDFGFHPSTDWAHGGPIIERERITISDTLDRDQWRASIRNLERPIEYGDIFYGPTPLTAAMRAYVASKFGDTVPDEVPA